MTTPDKQFWLVPWALAFTVLATGLALVFG